MPTGPVAWIVFAEADMNDFVAGPQFTALVSKALAGGQTDPFPRVMNDVALIIRKKIESNQRNVISATSDAIPPECHNIAGWLILEAMQTRLPGLDINEDQRKNITRSWDELNRIADGKDVVTIPLDPMVPTDAQRGPPAQIVTQSTRTVTACSMRGI